MSVEAIRPANTEPAIAVTIQSHIWPVPASA